MLFGIALIVGIVLISRNKGVRKFFWKYFAILFVAISVLYLIIDFSEFFNLENILGIAIMAFLIAMLSAFIKKWFIERKASKE